MMNDYMYIISWEIVKSGKVMEKSFLNKEEYENFKKQLLNDSKYKVLEFYVLDLKAIR